MLIKSSVLLGSYAGFSGRKSDHSSVDRNRQKASKICPYKKLLQQETENYFAKNMKVKVTV